MGYGLKVLSVLKKSVLFPSVSASLPAFCIHTSTHTLSTDLFIRTGIYNIHVLLRWKEGGEKCVDLSGTGR